MSSSSTSIAPGSLILVTGAGGFVGSAIVDQLLQQGFKVRGTTRTASKLDLFKQKADTQYGEGRFEAIEVPDLAVRGALDEALKGVQGVINVASDVSFSDDLDKTVSGVTSLNEEVLASAKAAGTVKSFVMTSSVITLLRSDGGPTWKYDDSKTIDDSYWFDQAHSFAEKSQDGMKPFFIYAASKVAGERAVWNFVEKEKPEFRVNSVLPDLVFGKIYNPAPGNYSTASGLIAFADGQPSLLDMVFNSPTYFVDVSDSAKVHVAALLDESANKTRFIAAAAPYSGPQVQEAVKAARPSFKEKDLSHFPDHSTVTIDNKASLALLQKHYHSGFKSLKEAVKANLE